MPVPRVLTLLMLALALALTASAPIVVAGAWGAPGSRATDPAVLRPPALEPDMRAFAQRRRARLRRLSGVSPIRGPVDYGTPTNRFGAMRGGHVHGGQDVFAPTGTALYAVRDGVVLEAGGDGARGNYLVLFAPRARRTYVYMHMQHPASARPGQRVRAGRRVGAVGCTGSCDGAHLHFEAYAGRGTRGHALDPLPQLRRWRHS